MVLIDRDNPQQRVQQTGKYGGSDIWIRGGGGFKPSNYSGTFNATTTAQNDAIAADVERVRIVNLDATNFVTVAFGTSAAEAEANLASGLPVLPGQTELFGVPSNATHIAYVADTATVSINLAQGV